MTTGSVRWSRIFRRGHDKEQASGGETTGGSLQSGEPVEVYTAANRLEAEVIKSFLQSFDIPVMLQDEAMGTVLGVTIGPLAEVKVLVPRPLALRAEELLEEQADTESVEEDSSNEDAG